MDKNKSEKKTYVNFNEGNWPELTQYCDERFMNLSYRPISLLSSIAKLMESLLLTKISNSGHPPTWFPKKSQHNYCSSWDSKLNQRWSEWTGARLIRSSWYRLPFPEKNVGLAATFEFQASLHHRNMKQGVPQGSVLFNMNLSKMSPPGINLTTYAGDQPWHPHLTYKHKRLSQSAAPMVHQQKSNTLIRQIFGHPVYVLDQSGEHIS